MSTGAVAGAVPAAGRRRAPARPDGPELTALAFWAPAALVLLVWVIYPSFATIYRSFFDRTGQGFVGLANYQRIFTDPATLVVLRNNAIWVLVFPAVVTALGVVFAVLLERVRYKLVMRTLLFMPMAISLLASGVIWRIVYQTDPAIGLVNAPLASVSNTVRPPGPYPGARPSQPAAVQATSDGSLRLTSSLSAGDVARIGLIGFPPSQIPTSAREATDPAGRPGAITGVVWRDFTPEGGTIGAVDPGESGMPGVTVDLLGPGGGTIQTKTGPDGGFAFTGIGSGSYQVQADAASFRAAAQGVPWLGSVTMFGHDVSLITPAIIVAAIWVWAGFATVTMSAGLATLSRDSLEAARIDGASEWQVFRNVTVPLLAPVITVTFLTLTINALKIFDLVYAITPGNEVPNSSVLALEMYLRSFTGGLGDQGMGSSLAVLLFLLVVPIMALNVRRFRGGGS
jgi:alpha-glucoside transport system permease protein